MLRHTTGQESSVALNLRYVCIQDFQDKSLKLAMGVPLSHELLGTSGLFVCPESRPVTGSMQI